MNTNAGSKSISGGGMLYSMRGTGVQTLLQREVATYNPGSY